MWNNLVEKLKSILSANTLIQEVYDYEASKYEGAPVAIVIPSDNAGEYSSNVDNERVYSFSIFLLVERGNNLYSDQQCELIMRELVDSVIDDLDSNWQLSGLTLSSGYSMLYMECAPSAWGYANREMVYRMAEIKVSIHLNVDINLIN